MSAMLSNNYTTQLFCFLIANIIQLSIEEEVKRTSLKYASVERNETLPM